MREVRELERQQRQGRFIGTALIQELRREVPAHLCIYCERPLSGRQRLICRRVDEPGDSCTRLYNSDWRRGQRLKLRQAEGSLPGERERKPAAGGAVTP